MRSSYVQADTHMSHSESDPPPRDAHLRVQLAVTPSPEAGCAVLGAGERGTVTMHETLRPGEACDDSQCKAEATADSASAPRLLEGNVTNHCVCPVFSEHDCLASIEGFEDRTLSVTVAVPDREELSAVVAALRERGATVRLRRIASSDIDTGQRLLELDTDGITDKQREAVRAAVRNGYYETPRKADLSDLADHLDVSRSAVSQRLTAVESKLVEELFRADVDGGGAAGD